MRLTEVTTPLHDADTNPTADPLVVAAAELNRQWNLAWHGHDDFANDALTLAKTLSTSNPSRQHYWVASDDRGQLVGAVHLALPLRENRHVAQFGPLAGTGTDLTEVYEALWAAAEPRLIEAGRTVVQTWETHASDPDLPQHAAANGHGSFGVDEAARWYLAHGFVPEQTEVVRSVTTSRATELTAQMPGAAAGNRLLRWIGLTPEEHIEAMVALRRRMSVEFPHADLDNEEEDWDADRIRTQDQRILDRGYQRLCAAAVHEASGEMVAYTLLDVPPGHDETIAYQEDTYVRSDHRGHGLGLSVKADNLRQLRRVAPTVARIHTWNAEENGHMVAINEALGFQRSGIEVAWQLRLG